MKALAVACPYCGYEWTPRVPQPKTCRQCTHWLAPWKLGALALIRKAAPKR